MIGQPVIMQVHVVPKISQVVKMKVNLKFKLGALFGTKTETI